MEEKNIVLDIIIEFIKALKTKDKAIETNINGKMYKICSCKYLLNQILRQWNTPNERWFISKRAKALWEQLTDEKIEKFYYNNKVVCTCEKPVEVRIYKGNENRFESRTLKKGDTFKFNSIFHEEHVVPISVIIKELYELKELNYDNVATILNKIALCRILKEEDKMLNQNHSKKDRPSDAKEVLNNIYKRVGIEIVVKK